MSVSTKHRTLVELGKITSASTQKSDPLAQPNVPYVGLEHIERDLGIINGQGTAADVRSTKSVFREGDLLYGKLRPYLNKVWLAQFDGICSTDILVFPKTDAVENAFLKYRFMTRDFVSYASENSNGVNLPRVNAKALARFPIWLPALPEQRRIVAEIEKQFTRLDAGVAALRRVQANLKRYRATVLIAACEGKLVPTEAELTTKNIKITKTRPASLSAFSAVINPSYETGADLLARILTERRQNWQGRGKYKEPVSSASTNLPQLPDGWACASLGEVCYRITDGTHLKPTYMESGMPFLSVKNVRPFRIYDTDIKYISTEQHADYVKRCRPEKGDILYTKVGATFGYAAINTLDYEFSIYVSLALLKYPQHLIEPKYIEMCMNSSVIYSQAQKRIKGIGRPDLHLEEIRDFYFPVPPLAEQTRIVAEVERRLSVVEELESLVTANLQRATCLRQAILQKAFTGELVVQSLVLPTNVIELPKAEHKQRPNAHFARALLSAEIVHRLHREPTFGRIKHQKIFHLCEHIAQMEEIHGQYYRKAAGPLDNKLIYANEAELKKQKWYQEVPRESYGHAYEPLANAGNHRKYVEGYWPDKLPLIEKLIELMRDWDTDRCEIFCTTYAAWNDLIILGKEPTEVAILREILERWHDSKKRFPEERWCKAIGWMRKKGFVPTGFGKPTKVLKRK